MSLKIIICGDVNGRLRELNKKVTALCKKKGDFDILFCIGDFFGKNLDFLDPYIEKIKEINIETFIISPLPKEFENKIDKNGCQICDNLTFLGSKGVVDLKNKLKVAFLSTVDPDIEDVNDLIQRLRCTSVSYNGVDILFTNSWPKNVETNSVVKLNRKVCDNEYCTTLNIMVHPRYHVVGGSGVFYEREPFKKHSSTESRMQHYTRYISLGSIKNEENEKYMYAVNVCPMAQMTPEDLATEPKLLTDNPFSDFDPKLYMTSKRTDFFFDFNNTKNELKRSASPGKNENDEEKYDINSNNNIKKKKIVQEGCWFCLGNPQVEKHLIVHISVDTYVAMPKGPLDSRHLLIVTIGHYQSMSACSTEILREIRYYMQCIKRYFSSLNSGVVFFERNFKANHFQMQAVPMPENKLETCKELFLELADTETGPGENLSEIPYRTDIREITKPGIPYLYIELSNETKLFGVIPKTKLASFDIQFPRVVLSHPRLLNCPEKVQWKDCIVPEDLEEEMATNMTKEMATFLK